MKTTNKKSTDGEYKSDLSKLLIEPPLLTANQKTALAVSLVWLIIGATVVAFLMNSQAQYNRGVFDGMTKTRVILQGK